MLKNYLRIAWRNLRKSKGFASINILGLSLGMGCSLLIALWVADERSVDAFHVNSPRLFSIYERFSTNGKLDCGNYTPCPLADELKATIPEIQDALPFEWNETATFSVGTKVLKQEGSYAGPGLFTMFSYPLLEGRAADALQTPSSIAISHSMANEFFGSPAAAIGKPIRYGNKKDFTIKAVFEDLPPNVSQRFSYIINWQAFLADNSWASSWGNSDPRTFILLRPGADPALVEQKITHLLDKYDPDKNKTYHTQLGLQRFGEMYLHGAFVNGRPAGGRIEYIRLFSLVALFIIVIACINFMNLTTAHSVKRANEIGVRKVLGAGRALLIRQFMGEAILIASLSAVLALLLVALALPAFNQLTGKSIVLPVTRGTFWLSVAGLALLTGIFSGSYPAFFLSAFNPIRVLKGMLTRGIGAIGFRKGLVVFQFVLSIVLIASTLLIARQINYVRTLNLGYDRENLLYIPVEGALRDKLEVFTTLALSVPGVSRVTEMTQTPTDITHGTFNVGWEGKEPNAKIRFMMAVIGYDFAGALKLGMAAGRDFSRDFPTDTLGVIINQTALALTGYTDPIGKTIYAGSQKRTIIGIVKDFHFRSLHEAIQPLILYLGKPDRYDAVLVRTQPGKTKEVIAGLARLTRQLNPEFPFTYKFSDEEYNKLYWSEQIIGRLSVIFAILAVCISCLGLLGLSIFTAEQRTKEIGIRKILGAGAGTLFHLLSRDFLVLVGIAFAIATPLSWWAMHQWLQQFAYQTEISWWIFGLSGLLALGIALLTVSFQAIRTARANPVESLRTE